MQIYQYMTKVTEVATSVTETTGERQETVEGNVQQSFTTSDKLQKFIFTIDTKHLLLQAVREHDAHRAPYRKKDEAFKKVKGTLIQNVPSVSWLRYQKAQMKTVRDKFWSLIGSRTEANKRDANTMDVKEVLRITNEFLDEFIA